GKEAAAQLEGETLNNARTTKKTDTISVWNDGYLQLAANDGLISQQDFTDSQAQGQTKLKKGSFKRSAPVQRQEMAYWLAKVLGLQPVYGQKDIFNSYKDWKKADPDKVPYIESILQKNIMNGDNTGNFNPTGPVTGQQSAQIISNAEEIILPTLKLAKNTGTLEGLTKSNDYTSGSKLVKTVFNIRNSNGKLDQIVTNTGSGTNRSEMNGKTLNKNIKDLVVYKNGTIGSSSLLKKGDRIEYIAAPDNTVKYVNVISNVVDTSYIAAQINTLDPANLSMNVAQFFKLNYPDINIAKASLSFKWDGKQVNASYKYSNNAVITIDGEASSISKLTPGTDVVLTIKNNIVTAINTFKLDDTSYGAPVIKGIVEDNNPQLGYITLYNENGTGTGSSNGLRTYNYADQNDITAYKNHSLAKVEDIETGDTVFIKTDSKGNINEISAVDNYMVKYGKIISKKPKTIVIGFDSGEQQVLDIDSGVLVISGGKLTTYASLKDGDRVKLIMHITNKFTRIKEITVEGDENLISSIYKGTVERVDNTSNKLITRNLQVLYNGQWVYGDKKGAAPIKFDNKIEFYFNDQKLDISKANKYLTGNEAYVAVKKDYGGEEKAVVVSFRNEKDTEDDPYDDTVLNAVPGADKFYLSKNDYGIAYGSSTIVVKDGRLVSGNSISQDDNAYVIANRSYDNGDYYAGVVQITEKSNLDFVRVYRGRIKSINESKDFTLESFSQLNGLNWDYSNTPKTLKITKDTQILDDSGVVGARDFTDSGDKSYASRTVYVLADGTNALLVSTAPFGNYNVKGVISDVTGTKIGDEGTLLEEPTGIKLVDFKNYDTSTHSWVNKSETSLNLLKNSIIVKGNKIAKPSDLKKGDKVRILKKQDNTDLNAYIVSVEG
ncbi:MAG TPA: S-layer homology domain-containing protein, partial [Clostridia bacterium]|nr:S-layer homology domain-containing protein [Clostridia bacterium]